MAAEERSTGPVGGLLWTVAWLIALVIIAGIILVGLDANQHNDVVADVLKAGNWLATPFRNAIPQHTREANLVTNWGLAAVVYLIAGRALAWVLRW